MVFSYVAEDDPLDFNKAIAVGASLDIYVEEAGGTLLSKRPTITAADMSEPSFSVVSFADNRVTVRAEAEGKSDLEVSAKLPNGDEVADYVNLRSLPVTDVKLFHSCRAASELEGYYLSAQSGALWLGFELYATNQLGNAVPAIGYGYHPVGVEPEGAMQVDQEATTQQWIQFENLPSAPAAVTVSANVGTASLTLNFVDAADIVASRLVTYLGDGCWGDGEHNPCTLVGGNGAIFYLQPLLAGELPICQSALAFELETLTPTLCEVTSISAPDENNVNESGWLKVKGLAVGDCRFRVTFPTGNAGAGAATELQVEVKGGEDELP
ncbi:MAG: hypothetical protein RBU37_24095 [Myxococcota bacterium]|nr:hypothetical protein [Myxococcota bacterium]